MWQLAEDPPSIAMNSRSSPTLTSCADALAFAGGSAYSMPTGVPGVLMSMMFTAGSPKCPM